MPPESSPASLITVVYAIGWVGGFGIPRTADAGPEAGTGSSSAN